MANLLINKMIEIFKTSEKPSYKQNLHVAFSGSYFLIFYVNVFSANWHVQKMLVECVKCNQLSALMLLFYST